MFRWTDLKRPIIALAPMADFTDSAFCRVSKRSGAQVVFREMISAEGILHGNEKTLNMGALHEEERPVIQQIFGADPRRMADSVRIIEEAGRPDGFDVNMGCPVRKITSNFNGAALMKEPSTAREIVRKMKGATASPVSVKTRLGWSRPDEILDFIQALEDAGADIVTVHGRTKEQGYSGSADWEMIGRARELVSIPVLCNGDVFSAEAATEALRISGCDGIMVARGALGSPWIFREITAMLNGENRPGPDVRERTKTIREHAELHAELHGDLITFRKHLVWYFKGIPGARRLRELAVRITTVDELEHLLEEYKSNKA